MSRSLSFNTIFCALQLLPFSVSNAAGQIYRDKFKRLREVQRNCRLFVIRLLSLILSFIRLASNGKTNLLISFSGQKTKSFVFILTILSCTANMQRQSQWPTFLGLKRSPYLIKIDLRLVWLIKLVILTVK